MWRDKKISLTAVLLSLMLGGCADIYWDRRDTVAFWGGDAPASNVAIHTIDPWPPAAERRRLTTNGELAQRAAERYRTNKTTPLKPIGTTSVQTSVSSSAGASGGGGGQ
jgi:hypothetical protein